MISIKGIPVTLYERREIGVDAFKNPIFEEIPVVVNNVLVAPVTGLSGEITQASPTELNGLKSVYQIAIPKGDNHTWENNRVEFFGYSWRVTGAPEEGIPDMLPLAWNKKYRVIRTDG